MHLSDLKQKSIKDLADLAEDHGIDGAGGMRRQDLIFALLREHSDAGESIEAEGVLEILPDGFGFLRAADHNYLPGADDVYVSPSQIRRFNLHTGDTVTGLVRPPKESERYFALLRVECVNHGDPDSHRGRSTFDDFAPAHPSEKLDLCGGAVSTSILDALCPLGKGQRCLITSPPRAGKTTLLREIAGAIQRNHSECTIISLLIDERPEDVTDFKRAMSVEVISTTFDEPPVRHVQIAEIVIEKAKRIAEGGADAVILLDSITQLARAYQASEPNAGHKAKRFFGAARKLEGSGSLTIIATAHADTDSRSDDLVLEQLRGACNTEIRLDRGLLDRREFPCIDVARSATRRDELLFDAAAAERARALREAILDLDPAAALARVKQELG